MERDHDSTPAKRDALDAAKVAPAGAGGARRSRSGVLFLFISILGLLFLSYLIGASVMFYQLPSSGFLSKAFMGARAWTEQQIAISESEREISPISALSIDKPGKTFDGFTLYACASVATSSTRAFLIDMQRKVVHQWSVPFSKIWPNPPHLEGRQINDSDVCIFACHLYGNGDLLIVFHTLQRTFQGYGLVKVDKDSNLLWSYPANAHHDVTVGEDGTIYTIVQRPSNTRPKGLELFPLPWLVDHLVMLSPDGKELQEPISILDAVQNSPYSPLLSPLQRSLNPASQNPPNDGTIRDVRDILHTNSVNVLTRAQASQLPGFKAGQVLLSMRRPHALAILDPETRSVVWGACGPWHFQHDAQFLDNGHLLIFDNIGSPRGSRVLEYDPRSGAFPWFYPGIDNAPFLSRERCMAQRLPNGNTLIVNSEGKEMIEVTQNKEVVWTCAANAFITTARRYSPDQLSFLKASPRP
jgi:hypothetical protein